MIARTWRGVTAAADADGYVGFLDRTGVADCRAWHVDHFTVERGIVSFDREATA